MNGMDSDYIILASHGSIPKNFPRKELSEFFSLHSLAETGRLQAGQQVSRYEELESKLRTWPRTGENDAFFHASNELAREIEKLSGKSVICGFNEFCSPDIAQAIKQAVERGAKKIIVVTSMLTRGGEHAEIEVAQTVQQAKGEYPDVSITYAWPFDTTRVAKFLLNQVKNFE